MEAQVANLNDLVKGMQDSAEKTRAEGKDEGLAEGRALDREEMRKKYGKGYFEGEEAAADELVEA